jgi:hypothetical protein
VVDDVDRGGPEAAAMLSVVAARCAASGTAVIATSATPLGLPGELRLAGLGQADLAEAVLAGAGSEPGTDAVREAGAGRALWVASRGLPGVALSLARELAGLRANQDPVVRLALRAAPATAFPDVDVNLVRLLEPAAERARVNATRTLRATIERIAPAAPLAAAHLRGSVRTGTACRYQPAPGGPSRWHV